jgi:hypothetical protein
MAEEIRVTPDPDATVAAPPRNRTAAVEAEPSLGELFKQLAQDSSTLIKQEVALAKTELTSSLSRAAVDATMLTIWGGVAMVGALVLVAFLVVGLGDLIDSYWLSALIVGLLFMIVGGALAVSYLNKLKHMEMKPDATIQTLKEDKQWAQAEVQQVKRDLTT